MNKFKLYLLFSLFLSLTINAQDTYFGGFDAKKIAEKDFENFTTLLGEQYKDLSTPDSVMKVRNSFTQEDPLKKFNDKYDSLVTPNTGYMYGTPVRTETKPSLEQRNYNVNLTNENENIISDNTTYNIDYNLFSNNWFWISLLLTVLLIKILIKFKNK